MKQRKRSKSHSSGCIMIRSIVIGLTIGAIIGYAYYYFIGCNTGSCPITSKPLYSVLYGAALGALLVLNSKKQIRKMIQMIKDLLGLGEQPDYSELVKQGAIILDVRSKGEFAGGHIKNAINIPVDQLSKNLSQLKQKDQPIICCCASGMRSGSAQRILKSHGYASVLNGGSWSGLQTKL